MKCPSCGGAAAHTSPRLFKAQVQRRYICTSCAARWTTAERILPETLTPYVEAEWRTVAKQLRAVKLKFRVIAKMLGKPASSVHLAVSPTAQRKNREAAADAWRDPEHRAVRRIKRPLYETRGPSV
jgi:transposase-like protein